ncbi:MAG: hypothetical protein JWQ35_176 [Bacteriovoracaceae bacterium]|nr:hypothetical protein [Bacteriovoracaceae bacterium]
MAQFLQILGVKDAWKLIVFFKKIQILWRVSLVSCFLIIFSTAMIWAQDGERKTSKNTREEKATAKPTPAPKYEKGPSVGEIFPDLVARYDISTVPSIDEPESLDSLKDDEDKITSISAKERFLKKWLKYSREEKGVLAVKFCKAHGIPNLRADGEEGVIGTWIYSQYKNKLSFYEAFESKLRKYPAIRVQVGDPKMFDELVTKEKTSGLMPEEAELLDKLYWTRDKVAAVSRFIIRKERKSPGTGWSPDKKAGGLESPMATYVLAFALTYRPGRGPKVMIWALENEAQSILYRNGFSTEPGKHSHFCKEAIVEVGKQKRS